MKAFINTPITKEQFLNQLNWHKEQDAFISGTYGDGKGDTFKGCAVGCSINSIRRELGEEIKTSEHELYEKYLGVPEWLARLEDTIFEGLKGDRQKAWPIEFAKAINVGADLDKIKAPFIVFILEQNLTHLDSCKFDEVINTEVVSAIHGSKEAIKQMIEAQKSGDSEKIKAAESAARSAARSAAESAAWSAAWSAWSAAESARSAAESARSAAESAAWSAAESARSAAYEKYANKLLELMREEDAE